MRASIRQRGNMESNLIRLYYDGVIYSKKNSKQIISVKGRPVIISNKNAKKNEKDMSAEFAFQCAKQSWKPKGRYSVSMYFTRKDNVRRDLDNLATSVLDALVLGGALTDDNTNSVGELHVYDMGVSRFNVGVQVCIESLIDVEKIKQEDAEDAPYRKKISK